MKQIIIAHWWNHGKKKLDFNGTIEACLESKGIAYVEIPNPNYPERIGYLFTVLNGATYTDYGFLPDAAFTALKIHYAIMGDKATLNFMGRIFTVNHNR